MYPTARRLTILLGLFLLSALVAPPQGSAMPPTPAPARSAPLALLVGVSNYEGTGLESLHFAVRDVDALDVELRKHGFRTAVLKNGKATKKTIETTLQALLDERQKGQLLLVALSGHGVQSIGEDGKEDAYFCPADTDKARFKNFEGNELNGKLQAQTAVLFSCAAGQFSLETNRMYGEDSDRGHGVFFYHVLEALRGKARDGEGKVTWYQLVDYVEGKVNARAKQWEPERARARARELDVALADLDFQTPHSLNNLKRPVVLAVVPSGGPDAQPSVGSQPSVGGRVRPSAAPRGIPLGGRTADDKAKLVELPQFYKEDRQHVKDIADYYDDPRTTNKDWREYYAEEKKAMKK